jgi:glycosyltransferase involved in cell wall biosynthesis
MSIPLSVIIIAKNEEQGIKECLETVYLWADEIIIIDDNSTDYTVKIARNYTDKIFTRTMDLEGKQRNFGTSKSKHDWVMMLDCDERITDELKKEIEGVLSNEKKEYVAFWIPQITYLGNARLKYGGWSNPHLRLYNKNYVRWVETKYDVVHPGIDVTPGKKGRNLTTSLIHYNFANIEDFVRKTNRQTTLEAIKWHMSGWKMGPGKALFRTFDRFMRRYIGKKGYKDGFYGFIAAVLSGFYQLLAYSKYREIKERGIYIN